VKVMEVDVKRRRIALTMRLEDDSRDQIKQTAREPMQQKSRQREQVRAAEPVGNSAMADAFSKVLKR